ncbi:unnamed protein product (macronuclear) [Paramecium tetraurelia]|uniref:Kinesin motor domain-containing protein n=1 Tax=Paramecium tetraurelia TaxID=5888 RepID=A0CZI7_PARTE|nr:uncharacterized protein GSPATT00011777001 [Paramecium tetraurelia]CAK76204.1 unnamed protein product [Paramecium tetraurelia]|eukprot:XP_001443601.1 hypothetical protein (macronuclear) [Paramecium tetraurelia strain d4-2]
MNLFIKYARPLIEDGRSCIKLDSNLKNTIIIEGNQQLQQDQKYFYFDYVAQQDSSQEDIFNIVGKQQAINCLDGYNGCVFVYGQTGSGKTYTMMGTQKQPGVLPRVIDFLFNCILEDSSENVEYLVKCSYLEIYNEHIIDLLNPQLGNLQLREDLKKGVYVEQLSEEVCTNVAESLEVLQKGSLNRHISSTQMNIESSRSHSVFTIQLESRRQSSQTQVINHRFSRFHFVDLAGSERQKQSQVQGERLREGCNINKSLHILGNVINSLVEDNQSYVHYRDSKLTFLLKDSLGGNSRTHLIANIQQSQQFYQETLSTLMFSKRVKQVKNKARINEDESGNLESLKNEIKRLKQELAKSVTTQQQKWESPKKFEQKQQQSFINEQFLQSLELESLMINDQNYIKLEEILKCYLEQSTESETALFLEIEKYLNGIKQLKEGFQLGQQLEQQLKFVIKLQNEQIQKLKLNQSADDIQQQIQQQLAYALQCQGLVMKTFYENLTLKEQQGAIQTVSKVQVQVDTNLNLLKDIVETVQNSLNERRQFQQQLDLQFNSQYVTLDKFKELETLSEYKEKLLSEQTQKLVFMEDQIKEIEKQILQKLEENGITFNENDKVVDVRDQQIQDLKTKITDLNQELQNSNQELKELSINSEQVIQQLRFENQQIVNQKQEIESNYELTQTQISEFQDNSKQQIINLEQQLSQLQDQNSQYSNQYQQLNQQNEDLKYKIENEEHQNKQLTQELIQNQEKLKLLDQIIVDNDIAIQEFKQQLTSYESIIIQLKKNINDQNANLQLNQQSISQLELENANLKQECSKQQNELTLMQEQVSLSMSKLENSEQELFSQLQLSQRDNQNLQNENSLLSKANQEMQSEMDVLILELNSKTEDLQNTQIQLQQKQQKYEQEIIIYQQKSQIERSTLEKDYQEQIKQQKKDFELLLFQFNTKQSCDLNKLNQEILSLNYIIKEKETNNTESQSQQEFQINLLNQKIQKETQRALQLESLLEGQKNEFQEIQKEQMSSIDLLQKQLESKQAVIQETSDHYNQVHELYLSLQARMEQKDLVNSELKRDILQNKSKLESQTKEIQQLQQKVISIENENLQSRNTMEIQQQGKLQDMTQKLSIKMRTIEQLTAEKINLNDKIKEIECESNKNKQTICLLEQQQHESQNQNNLLQAQIQSLNNELNQKEQEIGFLQQELSKQNQVLDKSSEIYKKETDQMEIDNNILKKQLSDKQKDIHKLEQKLNATLNDLQLKEQQIDQLKLQLNHLNTNLQQQLELTTKDNLLLKKEIQQLNQHIESQHEEIDQMRIELDQKQTQVDENKSAVKKLTKQLELEIKQYSLHLKRNEDQHKKEVQELVDQLDIHQKQLQQKDLIVESLNKQVNGLQCAFETKEDLNHQTQKDIQQLKDKLKSDQNKFTKIIQSLENANNQLKSQLEESSHQIQENAHKYQSVQKQNDLQSIQFNEQQEKYTLLKEQFTRLESQMKQESQIREQYSHIADKVTKENNELKQKIDKKQQIIVQLESALLQNEETLKNVHDRAKEFCKQQEKEINDIKDQYLKLEAEHNAILSQNQEREDENEQMKDQKDQALRQMHTLEDEIGKLKKELQEQHEKLTKSNNERSMLYKQIEEMQKDIAQLGGHNNPSQKIRYLNTIKQENSCLKQEKLYLSEQLQKEIEEKNKLLQQQQQNRKNTDSDNQSSKLDMQKLMVENQRLNNEMTKLNQILNLSGVKNRFSTIKGSDGDKIIQSVQLLIQELIDCKQEIQQRNKDQEGKNLKYQTMEKDLLVMKQKFYAIQKDNPQSQTKAQSPAVQHDVLRDNNRMNMNSGSVQRQSKPKTQQTFQFQ